VVWLFVLSFIANKKNQISRVSVRFRQNRKDFRRSWWNPRKCRKKNINRLKEFESEKQRARLIKTNNEAAIPFRIDMHRGLSLQRTTDEGILCEHRAGASHV
jgi:hypothetical protein